MCVAYQNVRLDKYIISSFSFELILMPEMMLEKGYVMIVSDLFQQMPFGHFCHD